MGIRQIRTNMRKAIEGLAEPAEGLGEGWANGMKNIGQAYCDIWQNSPQFIKENPVGGFLEGAMVNMCNSGDDQPDPPPIDLPDDGGGDDLTFTGGQCEGDNYIFQYREIHKSGKGATTGPDTRSFEGEGPITGFQVVFIDKDTFWDVVVEVAFADGVQTRQIVGDDPKPILYPDTVDIPEIDGTRTVGVEFLGVTNEDNPDDDCGDPPPPPDAPYWRDPDPEPPQPPPIEVPPPPGYRDDFPSKEINITFNSTTKNFEGDKFTISLQPPDIVFEYDSDDPPDFIGDDSPDPSDSDLKIGESPPLALPDLEMPQFPDISFPDVIGDGIERITDFIPTPLPGVTVGDIYDEIQDCFGEEDSEPLNTIQIPYYNCEGKAFENANLEATESSISNFPLDSFSETAANAALWCDEPEVRIGYPDWWAVRVGANRPQLVIVFRKDATRNYCSLVVPHYSAEPAPETSPLGSYQAGNTMGRETLTDNSKLTVYASSASEANRVLDEMAAVVKSEMRYSPPRRTIQERQGNPVEQSERIPRVVEVWPEGRATGSAPTKAWKVPPLNEPTP